MAAPSEKDHLPPNTTGTSAEAPDPEQQARLDALRKEYGVSMTVQKVSDRCIDSTQSAWEGPDDPHDPFNWSSFRKISIAVIVSLGQLVTLMSTSMMAAALTPIAEDLGMATSEIQIAFSIFVLGLAFAPFLIAALSEMYGRKPIWLISNLWYILWNALCPVGHSRGLMIFGRFMAGSGASVGITVRLLFSARLIQVLPVLMRE